MYFGVTNPLKCASGRRHHGAMPNVWLHHGVEVVGHGLLCGSVSRQVVLHVDKPEDLPEPVVNHLESMGQPQRVTSAS